MRILNVEFNNNKPHQFNAWINQVVVLLVFLCSSGIAQAEWPIEFGNSNHEAVVDSIVDSQGNTIIVGRFNGSTSFKKSDGAELVLNGVAQDDIFVAKFDSSGTFLWAQKAAGTANGRIFKVDVDPSDNVYISGHLFGTASATLSFSSITLNRGKFIAKLDNNGNWLWANSLYVSLGALDLGYTENRSVAISVTGQGLYVAYYDYLNGPNQTVLRFVKFDLDGNELWVYNANTGPVGSTAERVIPVDLEVVSIEDTASDIYLLADRSNSSLVASLTLICGYVLPVNTQNALIKISETITTDLVNGDRTYGHTCDWVTKVGERASNLKQDGGDIEADSTNVYYGVQGRISAYGASNGLELWNYGANAPVWIPDPANNPNTSTTSIAIDAEKNVYISGVYNFVSIFEGDPAVTDHSKLLPWTAQPSLYVAKFLSAEKKWAWVTTTPKPLHYPVIDPFSIRTQISMGPGDATVNLAGNFLGMMDKNVTVNSSGTYNGEMGTDDVGNKRVLTSRALPSDGALDLDGNDDYINLPGTLLNGLNNYAVSFDLRIDPSTPLQAGWSVFSASNGAGQDNEILLWFTSPTNLQIYEKGVIRSNLDISTTGITINDGNWHTLRFGRLVSDTFIYYVLYVDDIRYFYNALDCGVDCFTAAYTPVIADGGVVIGQEQDCFAGCFDPNQAFDGRLDNFTFWDTWNAGDAVVGLNQWYGYNITSSTPGVIAHWDFNDPFTAGDSLNSSSSTNYGVDLSTIPHGARPARVPGSQNNLSVFGGNGDGYSAIISAETGKWLIPQEYTAGTRFPDPNGFGKPRIEIDGVGNNVDVWTYFYWNEVEQTLYLLRPAPGLATISWPTSADGNSYSPEPPITIAPLPDDQRQFHIAGTSANLQPATSLINPDPADNAALPYLKFLRVEYASDNQLDNATSTIFNRGSVLPGQDDYVILHYVKVSDANVPVNEATQASFFQYVYTREWQSSDVFTANQACEIGSPVSNINHVSVNGENGIVITPENVRDATGLNVFIDANGANAAYNLQSHLGPIIAVNQDMTAAANDEVVVAWSYSNNLGQVWAEQTLGYNCTWPGTASGIQISDQQGSGELPAAYLNAQIYNQPDPALPGFNPNEEHALINSGRAFALRNDLNTINKLSDPYVLVKYQDANNNNQWSFKVYSVDDQGAQPFSYASGPYSNLYDWQAGLLIQPPAPLNTLPTCNADKQTKLTDVDPANPSIWRDHKGYFYAKAQGEFTANYFYPLQEGFYYDLDNNGELDEAVGTCVAWLDRLSGGTAGTPVAISYSVHWPDASPIVSPGETIFKSKAVMCAAGPGITLSGQQCELPDIYGQIAAKIIYDETDPAGTDPINSSVKIIDPLSARSVELASIAGVENPFLSPADGKTYFSDLPFHLRTRLSYDATNQLLSFKGWWDDSQLGDVHLLPNIMTARERDRILTIAPPDSDFEIAVKDLYDLTRNPNGLAAGGYQVGLQPSNDADPAKPDPAVAEHQELLGPNIALTIGRPKGTGYITVAFGDDPSSPSVDLQVLKIADEPNSCNVYRGNLWVVPSDNIFEEALTLRHTGDFAGDPDNIFFEWYYQQDENGQPDFAIDAPPPAAPWVYHAGLSGAGAVDLTIEGPGILTLSDNWFVMRYGGKGPGTGVGASTGSNVCDNDSIPSDWAGAPGNGPTRAMLATGWIKRVISGLNFFDQRFSDFHSSEVNTLTSMIAQTGEPYSGPIPFNPDPDVVNSVGLLEAYQTVFDRGQDLSINAGYNNAAANNQLLNVATRIADMYTLLGNEAYADAQDPTVGLGTDSELGSFASSIFTFQNQLDSPLQEELVLLRGRDGSHSTISAHPVNNRLFWNFTQGDGEVAYAQSYNINDQNKDGFINETDARILFPQGHGDAWGHYLSSVKLRYKLLQEPNFTWIPRSESVLVAGVPVEVDYLDERKFARAAAAKARAGTEIISLTYREKYVEAPQGQWQGYKDTNKNRAWGLDGWAKRAGQGAYFDWVTANAILPAVDPNPAHEGITKVDRTTVAEISLVASGFTDIQAQVDKADAGLNPLGLAKNIVPFDIDPDLLLSPYFQDQTHFDQIASRAQKALDNAMDVFNFASQQTQSLRAVQDDVNQIENLMYEQEQDFKHRLIEIFGYPYAGDMGASKTYPSDYTGPDILHYMYVDSTATGELKFPDNVIHGYYAPDDFGDGKKAFVFPGDTFNKAFVSDGQLSIADSLEVGFPVVEDSTWSFVAPQDWQQRRAAGEIQQAISDLLQAESQLQQAKREHSNLIAELQDAADLVHAEYGLYDKTLKVLQGNKTTITTANAELLGMKRGQLAADRIGQIARDVAQGFVDGVPTGIDDFLSSVRGIGFVAGTAIANISETVADVLEGEQYSKELELDANAAQLEVDLHQKPDNVDLIERVKALEQLWRKEALVRMAMFKQIEVVKQSAGRVSSVIAKGQRLLEERYTYRVLTAGNIQQHRYEDMTFRIFRNDALQKYRATFDLAARYVYLAAVAYDYETNLLHSDQSSGAGFLEDLVRQRTLGQVINGEPVAGTPGLADVMARLKQNFDVYRGQLGFNNPQVETNRFSLRYELFRKLRAPDDPTQTMQDLYISNDEWRKKLQEYRVRNLWDVPEFKRYMRPFTTENKVEQPGLVIPFSTEVNFGKNFFGHELGGGDSSYDPSNFATKVRAVGTWFSNYNGTALSNTPRIYLVPVGMDVLRSPSGDTSDTREWRVIDQKLPAPFPIGADDLSNPDWIPANDSLGGTYANIRRHSSYRAYHDSGAYDANEVVKDSRLIGRSVWNTQWLLVIPGGTLLYDADEGLNRFVEGLKLNPADTSLNPERDGNGISDILLNFQTYGYSGN